MAISCRVLATQREMTFVLRRWAAVHFHLRTVPYRVTLSHDASSRLQDRSRLVRYVDLQLWKAFVTGRRSVLLIFRCLRMEVEVRIVIRHLECMGRMAVLTRLRLVPLTVITTVLVTFDEVGTSLGMVHQVMDKSWEGVWSGVFPVFTSMAATIVTVQIFTCTIATACWVIRGLALHQFLSAGTKSPLTRVLRVMNHTAV